MLGPRMHRLAGTALICFGLLVYEILTTRLLGIAVGGPIAIFAIAFAMLGMGAATSLMSLVAWPRPNVDRDVVLSRIATVLGLSYPLCILLLTLSTENANAMYEHAIEVGGSVGLFKTMNGTVFSRIVSVGSIVFIPYFIFGIFIAVLFKSVADSEYHQYYAADLVGASLGCLFFVIVLDYFGYPGGLFLIFVSTFIGAAALSTGHSRRAAIVSISLAIASGVVALSPALNSFLEPRPALSVLARNYNKSFDAEEKWHTWSAESRVAFLTIHGMLPGTSWSTYAHQDGSGWAPVPSDEQIIRDSKFERSSMAMSRFVTMYHPKRVLVLFAGVGRDMVEIDSLCDGQCEIAGVEINSQMVDHAMSGGYPGMKDLLDTSRINLHVAEAREFLERDTSRYDAILLSWWGAGTAQYMGTSGMLAQYLYTSEAFETLLRHLTPNGLLVLYNGNKAQTLVNFRQVFKESGLGNLKNRVMIIGSSDQTYGPNFFEPTDSLRLIVKPSGFDEADMSVARATAATTGERIVISPDQDNSRLTIYNDIINGESLAEINQALNAQYHRELSIITDNRPFFENLVPRSFYFDYTKWLRPDIDSYQWSFTQFFIIFTLLLSSLAFIIILGPLVLKSGPDFTAANMAHLGYFFSLGAGFILIEVALIRKFGLILGHPSYSIAIVLAALIFSTGLGALATRRLFALNSVTTRRVVLALVLYMLIGGTIYDRLVTEIIAFPIVVKATIIVCALFPLGFLMGQLFPQGLARVAKVDGRLVPWAWAINGTASTIAVGIADLISNPWGFSIVLYIGAAFYAAILFFPLGMQVKIMPDSRQPVTAS